MSRKPKKTIPEDDGRSFCNMNVEGMPWYRPEPPSATDPGHLVNDAEPEDDQPDGMTFKERRAATRAYVLVNLPRMLTFVVAFVVAAVVVWLWLR